MKQNYILKYTFFVVFLSLLGINWAQTTFDFTGGVQTYTVPPGVGSIQIETWGAEGGTGTYAGVTPIPGRGGYSIGNLEVTPGQILQVFVGGHGNSTGPGGYNGGGMAATNYGAEGGGASDVRVSPYGLNDRVIVGGGGGGAAFGSTPSNGGNGGGLIGLAGSNGDEFVGGGGGTQVAGGAAGCCYGAATGGTFGFGGGPGDYHNAGGGGGWYGGGSGAGQAGAGGGSSYIGGVTSGVTTPGVRTGHGQVVITVLCSPMTLTVSDITICLGESFTAEADGEGVITWTEGVVNGVPFTPAAIGIYEYTANSTDPDDCSVTITIGVFAIPTVVANVTDTEICLGETVVFTGSGATSYTWDMGVVNGVPFEPLTLGTDTYTVTGTNGSGCSNTATVDVTALYTPTIVANASETEICFGDPLTLFGSGGTTYVWDMGVTNNVEFVPDVSGVITYTVTGTSSFSTCTGTDSIDITISAPIEITYTTVIEDAGSDGEIDITVTGGVPPYIYDWDNDGTGDFDDTEDLTGLTGGTYTIVVKDDIGCFGEEEIVLGALAGINENNGSTIQVFPNPTSNNITVQTTGSFDYELISLTGAIILKGNAINQTQLSMADLADGVYFVKVFSENRTNTIKVVKK